MKDICRTDLHPIAKIFQNAFRSMLELEAELPVEFEEVLVDGLLGHQNITIDKWDVYFSRFFDKVVQKEKQHYATVYSESSEVGQSLNSPSVIKETLAIKLQSYNKERKHLLEIMSVVNGVAKNQIFQFLLQEFKKKERHNLLQLVNYFLFFIGAKEFDMHISVQNFRSSVYSFTNPSGKTHELGVLVLQEVFQNEKVCDFFNLKFKRHFKLKELFAKEKNNWLAKNFFLFFFLQKEDLENIGLSAQCLALEKRNKILLDENGYFNIALSYKKWQDSRWSEKVQGNARIKIAKQLTAPLRQGVDIKGKIKRLLDRSENGFCINFAQIQSDWEKAVKVAFTLDLAEVFAIIWTFKSEIIRFYFSLHFKLEKRLAMFSDRDFQKNALKLIFIGISTGILTKDDLEKEYRCFQQKTPRNKSIIIDLELLWKEVEDDLPLGDLAYSVFPFEFLKLISKSDIKIFDLKNPLKKRLLTDILSDFEGYEKDKELLNILASNFKKEEQDIESVKEKGDFLLLFACTLRFQHRKNLLAQPIDKITSDYLRKQFKRHGLPVVLDIEQRQAVINALRNKQSETAFVRFQKEIFSHLRLKYCSA